MRTPLHRPDFFSRPLLAITVPAMRGPSYWTAAEREYIAMRTAQPHQCPFCADSHTELVRIASTGEIATDKPESVRPELRSVRTFLDGDPIANLRHAVFEAEATTDPALRQAAASGEGFPETWQNYTALVRDASYRITDTTIANIKAAGRREKEIYELTVGAALHTYDVGQKAMANKPA